MVNIVLPRNTLLVTNITVLGAIGLSLQACDATKITDPMPEPVQQSGLGIRLTPFVRIDSETAPRLNMLKALPDGRLFVSDQVGSLYLVRNGQVGRYLELKEHVDLFYPKDDNRQVGFLAFAFHPEFATNGVFYTVSTAELSGHAEFPAKRPIYDNAGHVIEPDHDDVIHRWIADDPNASTFSGSVSLVMRLEQPYRDHNTGEIAFNPYAAPGDDDYGMLYIGIADGGSDGFPVARTDPMDNGQDRSTPLGAILRIDPEASGVRGQPYGIPASNPFVDDGDPATLGEIYAFGLRNPHRFAWEPDGGHRLFTFDIGQWFIEEVNVVHAGGNYGWGDREGCWLVDEGDEHALYPLPSDDDRFGYRYPVAMYDHPGNPRLPMSGPGAIAGGFFYRGSEIPYLFNRMVSADFTSDGRFFVIDHLKAKSAASTVSTLAVYDSWGHRSTASRIIHGVDGLRTDVRFGEDHRGELYVTNKHNGVVYKIEAHL